GHWTHPLESGFFEWLALVPTLVLLSLLHSVGLTVVAAFWPHAANRGTALLGSLLLIPLLVLAGKPIEMLARYSVPLAVGLAVYALASRVPGAVRRLDDVLEFPLHPEDEVFYVQRAEAIDATRPPAPPPAPAVSEAPAVRESAR